MFLEICIWDKFEIDCSKYITSLFIIIRFNVEIYRN